MADNEPSQLSRPTGFPSNTEDRKAMIRPSGLACCWLYFACSPPIPSWMTKDAFVLTGAPGVVT